MKKLGCHRPTLKCNLHLSGINAFLFFLPLVLGVGVSLALFCFSDFLVTLVMMKPRTGLSRSSFHTYMLIFRTKIN